VNVYEEFGRAAHTSQMREWDLGNGSLALADAGCPDAQTSRRACADSLAVVHGLEPGEQYAVG